MGVNLVAAAPCQFVEWMTASHNLKRRPHLGMETPSNVVASNLQAPQDTDSLSGSPGITRESTFRGSPPGVP